MLALKFDNLCPKFAEGKQALNVGQSNLFELDNLWAKFAERNGVFLQE